MKLTRDQLKKLVKECLVEILSEGLGSEISESISVTPQMQRPQHRTSPARQQTQQRSSMPTQALRNAVKESAGGNSMLEAMLADTARNTLPDFMANDRQGGGSSGMGMGVMHTPEEFVNEEMASKWMEVLDRTSVG